MESSSSCRSNNAPLLLVFRLLVQGMVSHCAAFDRVWGAKVRSLNVMSKTPEGNVQGQPIPFLQVELVVMPRFARMDLAVDKIIARVDISAPIIGASPDLSPWGNVQRQPMSFLQVELVVMPKFARTDRAVH